MKSVVIYDANGVIYAIYYGMEELPPGLRCMFVDIPEGAQLARIDVSDPEHPEPVFAELPESDIGRLQKKMDALQEELETVKAEQEELIANDVELDYRQAMIELGLV